jgi:hypothetical protein
MRQSTLKTFAYGHDFGNSEICGVLIGQGWHQERQIPSVFAPGSWREVERFAGTAGKSINEYLQFGHYVLSYLDSQDRTVEKYIGQKVFDDGLQPHTTRADQERYWRNNYSLEALMVGSASCVQEPIYALHVVTGLPIHLYSPENAQQVQAALSGTHTFKLNGVDRSMVVLSVKVVAEGAGALIAYGSNEAGEVEGVIDIGGETTDLYAARGQRPLRALCDGKSLGVAAAADLFSQKFRETYKRPLSLDTCYQLLRQHVARAGYTEVRDSERRIIQAFDLADMIEDALMTTGQEIATFVAQRWKDQLYDMKRVLIVGGGAHYFKNSILQRISYAKSVPRPEMANATGYANLAEMVLARAQGEQVS